MLNPNIKIKKYHIHAIAIAIYSFRKCQMCQENIQYYSVCMSVYMVWFYTKSRLITKPKCIWKWHNGEFEGK